MFKHPKAPVVAAARYVIDSLEPRRLLTSYTIEGTMNDDTITINAFTNNGVPFYQVTINGELEVLGPGNPLGNSLRVLAMEGNDTIHVRDTNFDDAMSVWGGPGDDAVTVGNGNFGVDIDGIVEMFELENEGIDTLVVNDAGDGSVNHDAIHITDSSVYADEALTIDGLAGFGPNVEVKVVNMSTYPDRVFADAPVAGMTVNLGGGSNAVFYGGENNVVFGTVFPMTINAGVNDDWVYFRDGSGGTTGRDYTITPSAVMNQTVSGIEHVVLQTRHATNAAPNEIELTGKPAGVQSIDIDGGPGGLVEGSATNLSIGEQAAPIDLDSVDVALRLVNIQAVASIWDQDNDATIDAFNFSTVGSPPSQQLAKGAFRLSIASNVTVILFVTGGSTNDDFNVSVVAPNSTIQLAGGGGDDLLHSSAPPRLDSIYAGALFHFDGGAGNDSALFDDSSDAVGDGDQAYFLGPDWLAKGSTIGYNPDPLGYSTVEQLRLNADADHNDITIGSSATQQVTVMGGSGNDFITNYATASAALSSYTFATSINGGVGNDTLAIVDRVDQLVTEYTVDPTAFSFRVGAADVRTVTYDATLENLNIDEHDGAAASRLRSKPGALRLTVNGWGGTDSFVVGGGDFDNGWVTGTVTLAGGTGNDSIEFDDRLDISGIPTTTYTLDNLTLSRGSITFTYGSFESQTLRAAEGFTPSFVADVININAISLFLNSTTIIGPGTRQSSVNVTTGNLVNISGTLTVQLSPANQDTINVNDQNATTDKTYVIAANQMTVQPGGPTINYSGVNRLNLQAGSGADFIAVDTIAAGGSVNAHGNGGNDTLRLGVADVLTNLLGPATVSGDAGTDLLIAASAFGTQFESAELTSSTYTNGLPHAYNTVEQVRIVQTQGGSALNIRSVSAPTTVLGGAGDDAITIGNGDFDSNILANVSVSGAGGHDLILVDDSTDDPGDDNYASDDNDWFKPGPFTRYHVFFSTVDEFSVIGSPQNDTVNIFQTSGPFSFDGRGGDDTIYVANGILDAIIAPLRVVGGSGTDSIRALDDVAETPATFRVAGNTVTRTPGPFGAFGGLTHESAEFLTIFGGSAADTFNVRPLASTELTIRGLGPTTGPGDTLNLAFAAVTSPVFTPFGTGSGRYTFGNAAPLNYNEIETKAIDAVAPTSLGASFEYNLPRQEIRFRFSEDVSSTLSTSFLTLTNTTTGQVIPRTDLAVTYDAATNAARFTYLANPAGIVPDGGYHAEFAAGILDNFGNASTNPVPLDFFFLQGDANHDRRVNLADFNILAANFGQSNRTFSQGDFTYDGTVNLSDFNILAGRFGVVLGPSAGKGASGLSADEALAGDLQDLLE